MEEGKEIGCGDLGLRSRRWPLDRTDRPESHWDTPVETVALVDGGLNAMLGCLCSLLDSEEEPEDDDKEVPELLSSATRRGNPI